MSITLTSPSGTESILQEHHMDSSDDIYNWRYMRYVLHVYYCHYSVRHWDELANGTWSLKLADGSVTGTGVLVSWQLVIHGNCRECVCAVASDGTALPSENDPNCVVTPKAGDACDRIDETVVYLDCGLVCNGPNRTCLSSRCINNILNVTAVDHCGVCGGDSRSCCGHRGVYGNDHHCVCDNECDVPSTACQTRYTTEECLVIPYELCDKNVTHCFVSTSDPVPSTKIIPSGCPLNHTLIMPRDCNKRCPFDPKFDPNLKVDDCGVCGGDGSTCESLGDKRIYIALFACGSVALVSMVCWVGYRRRTASDPSPKEPSRSLWNRMFSKKTRYVTLNELANDPDWDVEMDREPMHVLTEAEEDVVVTVFH